MSSCCMDWNLLRTLFSKYPYLAIDNICLYIQKDEIKCIYWWISLEKITARRHKKIKNQKYIRIEFMPSTEQMIYDCGQTLKGDLRSS